MCFNSITEFSLKLIKNILLDKKSEQNICISTSSVYLSLVLIHMFTKNKTAEQVTNVIGDDFSKILTNPNSNLSQGLKNIYDKLQDISDINFKLFSDFEIKINIQDTLKQILGIEFELIDFSEKAKAVDIINNWVRTNTKDLIKQILTENDISYLTSIIIINTVFFKSNWTFPYDPNNTYDMEFYLSDNSTILVKSMYKNVKMHLYNDKSRRYKVLIERLTADNVFSLIVLPCKEITVEEVYDLLTNEELIDIFKHKYATKVNCHVPKFNISKRLSLKPILISLGITDLFEESKSQLTFNVQGNQFVSDIIQCSRVQIDEIGVIACGSTAITVENRMFINEEFKVNKPFIHIIYQLDIKIPLFITIIRNPNE